MFTVYCLIDPRNGNIFYVGTTVCSLSNRLASHCVMPKYNVGTIVKNRNLIVKELLNNGDKPDIVALKKCRGSCVDKWERVYFEYFNNAGFNLIQDKTKFRYSVQHLPKILNHSKNLMEDVLVKYEARINNKNSHNYKLLNPSKQSKK